MEGNVVGCFKLIDARILCSNICLLRSDFSVPINQQHKCYSLFGNFLSLHEEKKQKFGALTMDYPARVYMNTKTHIKNYFAKRERREGIKICQYF